MSSNQADTNPDSYSLLVVDDDSSILQLLQARLCSAGFQVHTASHGQEALETMAEHSVDLVLSDVKMPGLDGKGLLKEITASWPGIPVVLLTAYGDVQDAVSSMHQGAADYMTKPFDGTELVGRIQKLLAQAYPAGPESLDADTGLVYGRSPAMTRVIRLVRRIAPSNITVLIEGESGTGKELVAQLLHKWSNRSQGPFVVLDCGSTQPTLLESELFGHVKGAFTHATQDKKGLIETADQGTLLLDEIGNVSAEMQTRLLRFIQDHTMRRVGSTSSRTVDCRVLAATNADLSEMLSSGRFREDLYYRLKALRLQIPPLRERLEDLPLLVEHFLSSISRKNSLQKPKLSQAALQRMQNYPWPGNVRELYNVLEAGALLCADGLIRPSDLQLEPADSRMNAESADSLSLAENEKQAVLKALEKSGWVRKKAGQILGISRRTLHYKIHKYNIQDET
ncbi:MAG: sigma-54-dependent transcriptional regulator [Desulfohalobiaceae bacterium]